MTLFPNPPAPLIAALERQSSSVLKQGSIQAQATSDVAPAQPLKFDISNNPLRAARIACAQHDERAHNVPATTQASPHTW